MTSETAVPAGQGAAPHDGTAPPPAGTGAATDARRLRRVVAATVVGNVLEWYDFAVYGYFAVAIGQHFFPPGDPTASLLAALGIFAAGFLARPLGGVLFGHIADRIGRKPALTASVALMAVPTFLIGLLPTYEQIGLLAPALLLTLRLLQGLSVGGEYATSVVYAVEHAPAGRRGLVGSMAGVGSIGGMLLGSGIGALVTGVLHAPGVDAWGWRIPFLLGLALGLFGMLLRRSLVEAEVAPAPPRDGARLPMVAVFRAHGAPLLQVIGLNALVGVGFYLLFVYSVTYLTGVLHESMRLAFDVTTASLALLAAFGPVGGALSDRFGRKPVMAVATILLLALAWPLYRLLHSPDPTMVLLAQLGFAALVGPYLGVTPVMLVEAFPRALRCSAAAFAQNLAMAIFGGLSPVAATWLIGRTGIDMIPALMIVAAALVSLVAVLTLPETAHRSLR